MFCYRDKTFCSFYENCKHKETCHRALTDEVLKAAEEWWGGPEAPIAQFMEEPECFNPK